MPVCQMNEHLKIKFREQRMQGLYRLTDLEFSIETWHVYQELKENDFSMVWGAIANFPYFVYFMV